MNKYNFFIIVSVISVSVMSKDNFFIDSISN